MKQGHALYVFLYCYVQNRVTISPNVHCWRNLTRSWLPRTEALCIIWIAQFICQWLLLPLYDTHRDDRSSLRGWNVCSAIAHSCACSVANHTFVMVSLSGSIHPKYLYCYLHHLILMSHSIHYHERLGCTQVDAETPATLIGWALNNTLDAVIGLSCSWGKNDISYLGGLMTDFSNFIALAMDLLQSYTKPSICG